MKSLYHKEKKSRSIYMRLVFLLFFICSISNLKSQDSRMFIKEFWYLDTSTCKIETLRFSSDHNFPIFELDKRLDSIYGDSIIIRELDYETGEIVKTNKFKFTIRKDSLIMKSSHCTSTYIPFSHVKEGLIGEKDKKEYDSTSLHPEIITLINQIEVANIIDTEFTGYSGVSSLQYQRFEKLISIASIIELENISNHPNPVIRGYAFWGLAKKQYGKLEEFYINHAIDQYYIHLYQGCLIDEIPLIEFMTRIITPEMIDSECKKLNNTVVFKMQKNQIDIKR